MFEIVLRSLIIGGVFASAGLPWSLSDGILPCGDGSDGIRPAASRPLLVFPHEAPEARFSPPVESNDASSLPPTTTTRPSTTRPAGDPVPADDPQDDIRPKTTPDLHPLLGTMSADARELLIELERSGDDLRTFRARVATHKLDAVLGKRTIHGGTFLLRIDPDTDNRQFAFLIDFTSRAGRKANEHVIFDGAWLAEVNHNAKQVILRQIVPEGETFDPLKLGEGPFPMPIGQSAVEVARRFNVDTVDPPATGVLGALGQDPNVHGLKLTPKPGTAEAKDLREVQIFYDRAARTPRGVIVVENQGDGENYDQRLTLLTSVERNPAFTPEQRASLRIDDFDPNEWRIDRTPYAER